MAIKRTYGIYPYQIEVVLEGGRIVSVETPLPLNLHAHLRAGELMEAVAWQIMRWVKWLLVMPNTGPIDTIAKIKEYHAQLVELRDYFELETQFVMTIYFTKRLTPEVIEALTELPFPCAVKWYPVTPGATTGSGQGIHFTQAVDTVRKMEELDVPFLGHFESVYDTHGREIPPSKREGYCLQHEFPFLRDTFPELRISIEHVSTEIGVRIVEDDLSDRTVCTVTPQGMLFTENELFDETLSWRNHLKCMPYAKTEQDREAIVALATSGDPRCILGDDTAPHPSSKKAGSFEEAACGCWLPHSLALYALAFHRAGALNENFVKFSCLNGARWWNLDLPKPHERIRLVGETEYDIPEPTPIPDSDEVVISLGWSRSTDRLQIGHALDESAL